MDDDIVFEPSHDDCYIANDDPYPLCIGRNVTCHNCCIYENYDLYNSPYEGA